MLMRSRQEPHTTPRALLRRVCFHCRIGQTHLCPNGMLVGRDTNGGFAEYLNALASHVFPVPDSIDSRTAPMIQVLTTCLHAQRQINIFPAESVVAFGLGVTGQLHVQLAKARGASPVIGVTRTRRSARWRKARRGYHVSGGEGAIDKVREATDGRAPMRVIEDRFLPSVAASVKMARSGGRVLLGIITAQEGCVFYDLYFKEIALISSRVAKRRLSELHRARATGEPCSWSRWSATSCLRGAEGGDWDAGVGQRPTDEDLSWIMANQGEEDVCQYWRPHSCSSTANAPGRLWCDARSTRRSRSRNDVAKRR